MSDEFFIESMDDVVKPSPPMAIVNAEGGVSINWDEVERAAEDQSPLGYYAKLMLAIRDGTWKPLDR
jgi:hypothetical protein